MNKHRTHFVKEILIIVSVFIITHMGAVFFPGLFQWIDTRVYTLFFHIRQFTLGNQEISPYLLLFTIDDAFEKKYNTPTRERIAMAEIIENTREMGLKTIVLDIIYRQRDNTPEGDRALIASLESRGNIFCPVIVNRTGQSGEIMPEFISKKALWSLKVTRKGNPIKVDAGIAPFPELCKAAYGMGGITFFLGSDGIIHRIPLVYSCQDKFIPSVVLAGICHYYQVSPEAVSIAFGKQITLHNAIHPGGGTKDLEIPVDNKGQLIINFTGPWRTSITSFSLENLFISPAENNRVILRPPTSPPSTIAIIGDITTGSKELCRGIFDENFPLTGIIQNSLNTILTGKFLYQPGIAEQTGLSILFLFLIVLAGFFRNETIHPGWLFILFCLYGMAAYLLFIALGRLPDISLHLFTFTVSGILLFRMELKEIRELILKDDALEVPVMSTPDNSHDPADLRLLTDEEQQKIEKRLNILGLSTKQFEVAVLLIRGLQYKEIGSELDIKATAVGRRINRMYQRLGVNNKVEFINKVYTRKTGNI